MRIIYSPITSTYWLENDQGQLVNAQHIESIIPEDGSDEFTVRTINNSWIGFERSFSDVKDMMFPEINEYLPKMSSGSRKEQN